MGPFTPGPVADQNIANQLAEIGAMLLMFGVGLHFSPPDLMSVRAIAVRGALAQGLIAAPLGLGVAWWLGWPLGAGVVFGIGLAVASTVVVLRVLQERRLLETERGKITVGWLIVQDIAMVLVLVLLPALATLFRGMATAPNMSAILLSVGVVLAKFALFVAVMLIVGKKLIPAILHYVAHTGSRELFPLAVLAMAIGIAFAAANLAGVSYALGAFFAGMILNKSELSHKAASNSLPLQDAFGVLFFVSVGMLFDPGIVTKAPLALLATVFIIVIAKSVAAYVVVRWFGHTRAGALMISASLAQIGEFSFILANKSLQIGLLPAEGRDLILAGALITILLNPGLFALLDLYAARRDKARAEAAPAERPGEETETKMREPIPPTALKGHVVLVGHGRVGSVVSAGLRDGKIPLFVIEDDKDRVAELKRLGIEAVAGNAADPEVIAAANLGAARCLLVAIPDAFEGGQAVEQARAINPTLPIIARAHFEEEINHLKRHGADIVVMGEHEIAKAMLHEVAAAASAETAQSKPKSSARAGGASGRRGA